MLEISLISVSFGLLFLNLYGAVYPIPFSKDPIFNNLPPPFGRSKEIKDFKSLRKLKEESPQDYTHRLINLVSQHLIHYQSDDGNPVSWRENWLLRLCAFSGLLYFRFYEHYEGKKIIKRGHGFCSQISILVWFYLTRAHISASVVRFQGHVVNEVSFTNENRWVIDGDYGVIIPHSITELSQNPALHINLHYSFCSSTQKNNLLKAFQTSYELLPPASLQARLCFERSTYFFKWALPLTSLVIGFSRYF